VPLPALTPDYLRVRDFEYVQLLYDLAFLLEVDALARGVEVPSYRTFSLWRAAYSLDGYGTTIDRWLTGSTDETSLDYIPSPRIQQYLRTVREHGTLPELEPFGAEQFQRCLRLRSVRGLGLKRIASTAATGAHQKNWFSEVASDLPDSLGRVLELYNGANLGPWQSAHVVPPLVRFLRSIEVAHGSAIEWQVLGISDPLQPVVDPIHVVAHVKPAALNASLSLALDSERHFRRVACASDVAVLSHRCGWRFSLTHAEEVADSCSLQSLIARLDPFVIESTAFQADLHIHSLWSDGAASISHMAAAARDRGLSYLAVTDHSRSSKLQGGLTPLTWLRQAGEIAQLTDGLPVLHGIEVDILKTGNLDLPDAVLRAADVVVASVHSPWSDDSLENTNRLLNAIESGHIDVLAHPTSALVGKPGVPDYVRGAASVDWERVFEACARWMVAVEMNCFPSRLDLSVPMLRQAIASGCAIAFGSDAHARSHLANLRFGEVARRRLPECTVLNALSREHLSEWTGEARAARRSLAKTVAGPAQTFFAFDAEQGSQPRLLCYMAPPTVVPTGGTIVGVDLTAGEKATGLAVLDGHHVDTISALRDEEILAFIEARKPAIVSIDSPLGLPGGVESVDRAVGIVRVAEYDLTSVGIPAYPALIDSMQNLTLRGIRLKRAILGRFPEMSVIESYPGAAQDILCIPRKQRGLSLLKDGLRRIGLTGAGLESTSHDEIDAITAAVVGRYYEAGQFERLGVPRESELLVPKVPPVIFRSSPIVRLAGRTGAGKSVIARFLSVFYGFTWIRTREIVAELLNQDLRLPLGSRRFGIAAPSGEITETDLMECGGTILKMYGQLPLVERLSAILSTLRGPVVVDAIRDPKDVTSADFQRRPVVTWFIDSSVHLTAQRLSKRAKEDGKNASQPTPVDRGVSSLRGAADLFLPNYGTLEELRWRVEDALWSISELRPQRGHVSDGD
jgi:histidinol phosphatase-like PHP family hydrolase/predicted nuclease with RNAse H fold/dephospho-CoA kinase